MTDSTPAVTETPGETTSPETAPAVPDNTGGTPAPDNFIPADFKQMLATDAVYSSYYKDKDRKPSKFARDAMNQAFDGLAPRNTHEGMTASLLVQLYNAAVRYYFLAAEQTYGRPTNDHEIAEKLTRSYCLLSEVYSKQRGQGNSQQTITVVHINDGAQAVIGNVTSQGRGGSKK